MPLLYNLFRYHVITIIRMTIVRCKTFSLPFNGDKKHNLTYRMWDVV
jgi:hypothetical protein